MIEQEETKWNIVIGVLTKNLEILERNTENIAQYIELRKQVDDVIVKKENLIIQNKSIVQITNEARLLLWEVGKVIDTEMEREEKDND